MAITTADVLDALVELAELTALDEGSPQAFRVRAYEKAHRGIEAAGVDVAALSRPELEAIDGVGSSIAAKIRQLVETGTIPTLEKLRAAHPPGVVAVSRIPGIGPKTVALLRAELGIESLDGLREALVAHRLRALPAIGAAREARIARALERLAATTGRTPIAAALPVAERLLARVGAAPGVEGCHIAGSLRRLVETIGDIDLVVVASDPEPVMDAAAVDAVEVLGRGETKMSVVTPTGLQVDVRVVEREAGGAALLYFTGSKAHNVALRQQAADRGWLLNEYGLFVAATGERLAGASEEEIYRALDMSFIPAPLREDTGEIEAAGAGTLPRVVELGDIHGDLHVHTTRSGDGRSTIGDLLTAASHRGYEYVAITDHGENLAINGSSPEEMAAHRDAVRQAAARQPGMDVYFGCELNIGPDGSLDYDPSFREVFDFTVASIHSHFDLGPVEQTARILRAAADPGVDVIGHLTGRMIGRRPGIELDVDKVLAGLARAGVAVEANAALERLDASADTLRRAVAAGVEIVISTDAHHVGELDRMAYGVENAQRGWVPAESVVNTRRRDAFAAWVDRRRI